MQDYTKRSLQKIAKYYNVRLTFEEDTPSEHRYLNESHCSGSVKANNGTDN